jgi:hypothetical protein
MIDNNDRLGGVPPRPISWVKDGECIRCTSHKLHSGYPAANRYGFRAAISRLIAIKRHGNLPPAIVSRHTCDNRWCINPNHIIIGTRADNNRDRDERGRQRTVRGIQHPKSKLTQQQVSEIKFLSGSQRQLAKIYNVSQTTIWKIRKGLSYA